MLAVPLLVIFLGLVFWAFLEGKDVDAASARLLNPITILLTCIFHSFFAASSIALPLLSLKLAVQPRLALSFGSYCLPLPREVIGVSSFHPLSFLGSGNRRSLDQRTRAVVVALLQH